MLLPELFKNYLKIQRTSPITIKNYLADVNHFLEWLAKKTGIHHQIAGKAIFGLFTVETIEEYKADQLTNETPLSTLNRRLSALRKFGQFGQFQGWIAANPGNRVVNVKNPQDEVVASPPEAILTEFRFHLESRKVSRITIKNYLSDLRHFLAWLDNDL